MENPRVIQVIGEFGTELCTIPVPDDDLGLYVDELLVMACSALPGDIIPSTMRIKEGIEFVPAGMTVTLTSNKDNRHQTIDEHIVTVRTMDGECIQVAESENMLESACSRLHRRPCDWELEKLTEKTYVLRTKKNAGAAGERGGGIVTVQFFDESCVVEVPAIGSSGGIVLAWAKQKLNLSPNNNVTLSKRWCYPGDTVKITLILEN
jgi:hypothetical protein